MRALFAIALLACRPAAEETEPWSSPIPPDTGTPTGDTNSDTDTDTDTDPCSVDADGDGHDACVDCDDDDDDVYPGAVERCNGIDDDCDGVPHAEEADGDGDGELDCSTCDDAHYWGWILDIDDKQTLTETIHALSGPISCFYSDATDAMFLDIDNQANLVTCVYTGDPVEVYDEKPDEDVMNTEHSWPQSKGADSEPAKCDLHHLFPTVTDANSTRANWPFGEVVGTETWSDGGSSLGISATGTTVFEPRDAHKGDVARAMVYFAVRYEYDLSEQEWALYDQWDSFDPVDEAELDRTFAIQDEQGNANPFVACPGLIPRLY